MTSARAALAGKAVSIFPALGLVTSVRTDDPVFALTFDDGPDPRYTAEILRVLADHGSKASFFMLGEQAARYPELVTAIAEAGHCVGNHGWEHVSLVGAHRASRRDQIRRGAEALGRHGSPLFRPPYGELDMMACLDVRRAGHEVISWDVSARDWQVSSAQECATSVVDRVRPGSIVLFHDRLADAYDPEAFARDDTVQAVDIVLRSLDATMRSVTLPDLLSRGVAQRRIVRAPVRSPATRASRPNPDRVADRHAEAPAAYTSEQVDTLAAFSRHDVVETYADHGSQLWECERAIFDAHIEPDASILDLGVGTGRTSEHLSKMASRYVGLDFAPPMIDVCQQRFPHLEFVCADASNLRQFDDHSFDVVVFSFNGIDCLHPATARYRCIREIRRVLRNGGVAIISEHNPLVVVSRPRPLRGVSKKLAAARLARAARETARNLVRVARIARAGKLRMSHGFYFDATHGGNWWHAGTPASVREELGSFGFEPIGDPVGVDHPKPCPLLTTPWYYYAFRLPKR